MSDAPFAFILSWERPIFLWATLDSLYRNTKKDVRFVLIDNNSQDPLVHQVIRGFQRREMFHDVLICDENDPNRMNKILTEYLNQMGEYFYFIENDVTVPDNICWANEYDRIYRNYPGTAMIGSFSEKSDFIDPELIRRASPDLSEEQVTFYSKSTSPELHVEPDPEVEVWPDLYPNPPGRLILLSTNAARKVGILPDAKMAKAVSKQGLTYRICTTFKHRHLSLLNWFDVEDESYGNSRKEFFSEMDKSAGRMSKLKRRIKLKLVSWLGD